MKKKKLANVTSYIEQELLSMIQDNVIEDFVLCVRVSDNQKNQYLTITTEDSGTLLVCAEHCKSFVRENIEDI